MKIVENSWVHAMPIMHGHDFPFLSIDTRPPLQVIVGVAEVVSQLVNNGLANLCLQLMRIGEVFLQRPFVDDDPMGTS